MRIDLHGKTSEEAISEILSALTSLEFSSYHDKLEIITGKGSGTLLMTTLNILDEEGVCYRVLDGKVIVLKVIDEKNKTDKSWIDLITEEE